MLTSTEAEEGPEAWRLQEESLGANRGPTYWRHHSPAHSQPALTRGQTTSISNENFDIFYIPVKRQRARVVNGYASKAYGFGRSGSNPLVVDYFC